MNILVVCNYDLYQNLTYSFVHSQIREYVKLGHRVRVLVPAAMGKKARNGRRIDKPLLIWQADGVEIYDMRFPSLAKYGRKHFNDASALATVKAQWNRIFKDFQPDVVHAHTFGLDSKLGVMIKKRIGCPLVVTTHGGDTTVRVNEGKLDDLRAYCEDVDVVVAVSNALERRLRVCGTKTEIRTIHNGYNDEGITDCADKVPCSCLQVSNLIELKQIPVTIRAFEKIHRQYPGARLTIIGRGPDREHLEKLCDELHISDAVTFTGQLQHPDVMAHMAKTQFYIMPSVREGLPISYLEAMGMGCVIVGTATEGIAEVVDNGFNGILVQPGDYETIAKQVCDCIADPAKAAGIAAEGRNTARQLTWNHNARKLVALFEELIAR